MANYNVEFLYLTSKKFVFKYHKGIYLLKMLLTDSSETLRLSGIKFHYLTDLQAEHFISG